MLRLLLMIWIALLAACSSVPSSQPDSLVQISSLSPEEQYEQLMFFYFQWKGVPHRDGGTSKQGVDCSGLMVNSYKEIYGVNLPRSTQYQSQKGVVVSKRDLKTGDLVFFKTGFKQLHVGVYLKDNQFMHASSSRGVMISKLNNPYWKDAYWHGRRIIR